MFARRRALLGELCIIVERLPACPMLFIYGKRKLSMFHTQAWIDELVTRKGNQVVGDWLST